MRAGTSFVPGVAPGDTVVDTELANKLEAEQRERGIPPPPEGFYPPEAIITCP